MGVVSGVHPHDTRKPRLSILLEFFCVLMSRERDPLVVGRVIGDVIDPFVRTTTLGVSYGSRKVTNGREFKPSQVVNQPRVEVGGHDLRSLYTLVRPSVHAIKVKKPRAPCF